MILTAAGVMIGLVNISASERVSHYPHPRPEVERNDKEITAIRLASSLLRKFAQKNYWC